MKKSRFTKEQITCVLRLAEWGHRGMTRDSILTSGRAWMQALRQPNYEQEDGQRPLSHRMNRHRVMQYLRDR